MFDFDRAQQVSDMGESGKFPSGALTMNTPSMFQQPELAPMTGPSLGGGSLAGRPFEPSP